MRHHNQLRTLPQLTNHLQQAREVAVIQRRLNLIQGIERRRARHINRNQQRQRSERTLTARQQRQAFNLLTRRARVNLHTRIQRIGGVVQLKVALASREQGFKDAAVVGVNVIHRGGEHLRNVAADLVHYRVQVAAGRLQILNLLVQVGVAFGQRLVLLQRQRVNGAQRLQFGAGCLEASAHALGGGFGSL